MFRWEVFWEASPVPRLWYMEYHPSMVKTSCWSTSLLIGFVSGIPMIGPWAPSIASTASWTGPRRSWRSFLDLVNIPTGIGLTSVCHMGDISAPPSILWCCPSPSSRHCSIEAGLLGVLWSAGPCPAGVKPADGTVWSCCPSIFWWGPRDWGPTTRGYFQWGDLLGCGQGRPNQGNYLRWSQVPNWGSVPPLGWLPTAPSTPSSGALLGYDPAANGTGAIPLPV